MKKLFFVFFILSIFISVDAMAANRTIVLEVQNMTCPVCPLTVKKALGKVDGVQQVEIDYASKSATVRFDNEVATTEKLIEATKNVGYPSTVKKESP